MWLQRRARRAIPWARMVLSALILLGASALSWAQTLPAGAEGMQEVTVPTRGSVVAVERQWDGS